MESVVADLNEQQLAAATTVDKPVLVLAGPGTGKTKMLVAKFVHLVLDKGIPAERILITTFTRKATHELEERLTRALQDRGHYSKVEVRNFHSFALDLIRAHTDYPPGREPVIVEGATLLRFLYENRDRFDWTNTPGYARWVYTPLEKLGRFTSRMLAEAITPEEAARRVEAQKKTWEDVEDFLEMQSYAANYGRVLELLRSKHLHTYDLMLFDAVNLLEAKTGVRKEVQGRFDYLLVDEVQDNNRLQSRMVELIAGEKAGVTVVGDEDQGIFKFRGASRDALFRFEKHFKPKVVNLSSNFRSSANIVQAAWTLIGHNSERFQDKTLKAVGKNKDAAAKVRIVSYPNEEQESIHLAAGIQAAIAKGRRPRDVAVLYRSLNHVGRLCEELEARGIPFEVANTGQLLRWPEIRNTWAWLSAINDPYADNPSLERVLASPILGISILDMGQIQAKFKELQEEKATASGRDPKKVRRNAVDVLRELESGFMDKESRQSLAWARRTIEVLSGKVRGMDALDATYEVMAFLRPQALYDLDDPRHRQSWSNLAHFLQVVDEYQQSHPDSRGLGGFLAYLDFLDRQGAEFQDRDPDRSEDSVKILTAHSAKGLEFAAVFVPACSSRRFPSQAKTDWLQPIIDPVDKATAAKRHEEEERRLFYVAMTRAQQDLVLTFPRIVGEADRARSAFLDELLDDAAAYCELEVEERQLPAAQIDSQDDAALARLLHGQLVVHDRMDEGELRSRLKSILSSIMAEWSRTGPAKAVAAVAAEYKLDAKVAPKPANEVKGKLILSASALDTYAKCPRQYYFRHQLHIPTRKSGGAAIAGSNVHRALEVFHGRNKGKWRTLTNDDLLAVYDEVIAEGRYESPEQAEMFRALGRRILGQYLDDERKGSGEPSSFEMPFGVEMEAINTRFVGFIDRVDEHPDGTVEVIDYKTGAVQGPQGTLANTWQMPLYVLALEQLGRKVKAATIYGMKDASLGLGPIKRVRIPRVATGKEKTELTDAYMKGFEARLKAVVERIRSGDFTETPEERTCKFCDYRILCPAMEVQHE
jgi:DNA helicase-2/ATP-dependent DNA helicase PcrA